MQDELVGLDPRHDGPLIRRINAQISSLRAQLAPLLQSLTAQGCFADRPCQQLKNARPVAVDTQVTVRESDHDVDTSIDIQPGDSVFMEADGQIWAGVWLTGDNWPKGWDNVDHDPKFPLHTGDEAHPYSLIAKLGASSPHYYVGALRGPETPSITQPQRLFLRTNDDAPGNGNGAFTCHVIAWR